jgi:hypothetical protein
MLFCENEAVVGLKGMRFWNEREDRKKIGLVMLWAL